MRFSNDYRNSVGFIFDAVTPVGAFFLIQFRAAPPEVGPLGRAIFMVTARHNVQHLPKPTARYWGRIDDLTRPLGYMPEWPVTQWVYPSDDRLDLAVAVYDPLPDVARLVDPVALVAEWNTAYIDRPIDLGELVYYAG